MAKHIELWRIDKLIPYARNPRTHSDAQVAQIAASIAEFGFNSPVWGLITTMLGSRLLIEGAVKPCLSGW